MQYSVAQKAAHPLYGSGPGQSQLYDFGMLRFTGASGATPVLPAITPAQDNLAANVQVNIVGYGNTENGGTSWRHHIVKPLLYVTDMRLGFDQATSGICSGDSGGPVIHTPGGQERVAGVNSYTTSTNCVGNNVQGTAVRVSAVYDTFITPFINGTPYQQQTCDQCTEAHTGAGDCTQKVSDCFSNTDCSNYVDCIDGCTTQSCVDQCAANHVSGAQLYQEIFTCVCTVACVDECSGEPMCAPPPACGFTSSNQACGACLEQSCCAEGKTCAADPLCVECATSITPPPECATDADALAFNGCLKQNCAEPCNLNTGGSGGSGGGGTGGAGPGGASSGGQGPVGGGTSSGSGGGGGADAGSFTVEQGGCNCALPRGSGGSGAAWLLALGLTALREARRRRA